MNRREPIVIAIDGPAGAGKSTVARAVAAELGVDHLDTGAMYRAVTLAVLKCGIDPSSADAVAEVARTIDMDVDDRRIRDREVTAAVSAVAANPAVRAELVERQRAWITEHGGGVVEGRDIGSVVFPDAELKLFVTASPRVRAERRVAEIGGDVDEMEASIVERDRTDTARAHSPLTEASGSRVVDTTAMTIAEVVEHIVELLDR